MPQACGFGTINNRPSATVTVQVTTKPLISGAIFGTLRMTASATAQPVCGITAGGQC